MKGTGWDGLHNGTSGFGGRGIGRCDLRVALWEVVINVLSICF